MTIDNADRVGNPTEEEVLGGVWEVLEEMCGTPPVMVEALSRDDELEPLGLDSITLTYVFTYFEQKHDLIFENDDIDPTRYRTIGELVDTLRDRISTAAA